MSVIGADGYVGQTNLDSSLSKINREHYKSSGTDDGKREIDKEGEAHRLKRTALHKALPSPRRTQGSSATSFLRVAEHYKTATGECEPLSVTRLESSQDSNIARKGPEITIPAA